MTKDELKKNLRQILEVAEIGAAEAGVSQNDYFEAVNELMDDYLAEYRRNKAFTAFLEW